ncbi:CCR4-NOT transcription complex subunit 1 [Zea mays]|uniref:CCR4-NOT transcription complex subunit 1 n=1 Tax=Zea mays TaxID=4577 RepID=A0A3L6DNK2_MAIZE|nr:CCR4-NOT transcription complex subunit 1 [Zea mays]
MAHCSSSSPSRFPARVLQSPSSAASQPLCSLANSPQPPESPSCGASSSPTQIVLPPLGAPSARPHGAGRVPLRRSLLLALPCRGNRPAAPACPAERASIEPNFHDLYLKFFDKVNSKSLNKEILKATYENCKVLLRSDLIKSSSEERYLLKNLGSWLGKFTIGRNEALRAKEIDPKSLIVEILEPCQSSIAYRPPNPWTMGILSLLVEIYNLPNLKMNLKFDIEVLFKNLTVDIKDVKPTSLLKDRLREVEGNPDFSNKDVTASQTPVVAEVPSGTIPSLTHMEQHPEFNITSRAMSLPSILNQLMAAIPREEMRFKINPKLGSLGPQLQYSKIMDLALDKANREIILLVIQRSVTIASRTTKELILRDYELESDNNTITRSAHLMVGTLAGSLAHVTCKEPLRVALYSNLRNLIQNLMSGSETIEQLIHTLINDNLDLGCAIIEAVATRQVAS